MNNRALCTALLAISLGVSGCSYMPSWAGGKEEVKPHLPGDRIAVLPVGEELQPDSALKDIPVIPPSPKENDEFTQHIGNLAVKGNFDNETHTHAGKGNSFDFALIPSPVIGGGMVFSMDAVGNISAHDMNNLGNERWNSVGVADEDETEIRGGGLAYDNGHVYATSGRGVVAAFDASNGKQLWRKNLLISFRSAPRVAGDKLYATTIDNQLFVMNKATGDLSWSQRGIGETAGLMNSVSPAVANEMVVVPYSSGEVYALAIADGKEIWNDSLSLNQHTQASAFFAGIGGDPVIDDSVVFAVSSSGMVSALTMAGGQPIWNRPIGSINTPWLAGDFMYMLTTDNTLICFVKYDGRIRWSTKLASYEDEDKKKKPISWKGPVMVNSNMALVSSNGQLVLVSAVDGKVVATKSIPDEIYTPPVVAGGHMYLVSQDATLYSLQ